MKGRFVRIMPNLMLIAMQAVGVKRKVFFLALVLFCYGVDVPLSRAANSDGTPDAPVNSETLEQFLDRASERANEYTAQFVDLTAEENKLIELFGQNGQPGRRRTIFSELLIYESVRSRQTAELRDVQAVNGHMVTEHDQRLLGLLREVISDDPDVEVDRVSNEEQRRYDLRYQVNGFTLHQALPLRSLCRPQFRFELAEREGTAPERLVVNYQQIGPCPEAGYALPLPRDLRCGAVSRRCASIMLYGR